MVYKQIEIILKLIYRVLFDSISKTLLNMALIQYMTSTYNLILNCLVVVAVGKNSFVCDINALLQKTFLQFIFLQNATCRGDIRHIHTKLDIVYMALIYLVIEKL